MLLARTPHPPHLSSPLSSGLVSGRQALDHGLRAGLGDGLGVVSSCGGYAPANSRLAAEPETWTQPLRCRPLRFGHAANSSSAALLGQTAIRDALLARVWDPTLTAAPSRLGRAAIPTIAAQLPGRQDEADFLIVASISLAVARRTAVARPLRLGIHKSKIRYGWSQARPFPILLRASSPYPTVERRHGRTQPPYGR